MTLHLNLPHKESQAEVREARKLLRERIRTDWEFPTLPEWTSSGREQRRKKKEETVAGFRFHNPTSNESLGFDPVEWRQRQYSSASDTEETPVSVTSKGSSVYKFDGPESVGTQLLERKVAKKRKRFEALEEEMRWNEGLSHWMRRRDVWCCARTATDVQVLESGETTTASSTSASASSSPRSSTSSSAAQTSSSSTATSLATSPNLAAMATTTNPNSTVISPAEILVPIAPPILANHPIRRKITQSMYPEIYAKIILQSRTPSVPINLQTLVNALVQGWKDDGEWPPKPGVPEKSIGRKKGIRDGVKRVLKLTGV